jgi:hypothetical protein
MECFVLNIHEGKIFVQVISLLVILKEKTQVQDIHSSSEISFTCSVADYIDVSKLDIMAGGDYNHFCVQTNEKQTLIFFVTYMLIFISS